MSPSLETAYGTSGTGLEGQSLNNTLLDSRFKRFKPCCLRHRWKSYHRSRDLVAFEGASLAQVLASGSQTGNHPNTDAMPRWFGFSWPPNPKLFHSFSPEPFKPLTQQAVSPLRRLNIRSIKYPVQHWNSWLRFSNLGHPQPGLLELDVGLSHCSPNVITPPQFLNTSSH